MTVTTKFPWYDPKHVFDEKTLTHHMIGPSAHQVRNDLMLAFQRDVEGKIRQALIDMGWTPPPKVKPPAAPSASPE